MNKKLFWTGITMQSIHLLGFLSLGLTLINWNLKVLLGIGYVFFNIISLAMIFIGAIKEDD